MKDRTEDELAFIEMARHLRDELLKSKAEVERLNVSIRYAAGWLVQNIHGINQSEAIKQIIQYGKDNNTICTNKETNDEPN